MGTYLFGIEVLLGEGAVWTQPARLDLVILVTIIVLLLTVFIIARILMAYNKRKSQNHQLFLYRAKNLGLTNFQFKTINGIASILALKDPNSLLSGPALFESAIGRFLDFLKEKNLSREEMIDICKDMVITYEKIYHKTKFRTPLERLPDLDLNVLLCFIAPDQSVYIAKVLEKNDTHLTVQIIMKEHDLRADPSERILVYLWRTGDAEYSFESAITEISGARARVVLPGEFSRGKEAVHPYVEAIVPCVIANALDRESTEDYREYSGTLLKVNDQEAHVRMKEALPFDHVFFLGFTLDEFNFRVQAKILGDKSVSESTSHYFHFKFLEMSQAGHAVLRKFISDRLLTSR